MATAPPSFSGGNLIPQPAAMPMPNNAGNEAIAGGLGALAGAVYEHGRRKEETDQRVQAIDHETAMVKDERNESAEMADRAAAIQTSHAALELRVAEMREQAGPGGTGHLPKVEALVDAWQRDQLGAITDPRVRERLMPHIAAAASDLKLGEAKWAIDRRAHKQVDDVNVFQQQSSANAFTNPTGVNLDRLMALGRTTISALDLPDDAKTKLWTGYRHDVKIASFQGLKQINPALAIDAINKGALNDVADGEELNTLRQSAIALQDHRDAQAREAQSRAIAQFEQGAKTLLEDVHAGVSRDPAEIRQMAGMAQQAGKTDLAHDLLNGAATAEANNKFGPLGLADQVEARAAIQNDPHWRGDPQKVAYVAALDTLIDNTRRHAANDKLSLYAANGGQLAPLNLADQASVRARLIGARTATQRYGGDLQLLTEDEAKLYRDQFDKGTAADRAGVLASVSPYGGEVAAAFMRQVAPNQPQYVALASLATMRNHVAGTGLAREALNGWEELKANKTLIDSNAAGEMQAIVNSDYAAAISNLTPEARLGAEQVARGIYATRAVRKGVHGFDPELWKQSLSAAYGAAGDGTGGFGTTRKGNALVLPRGVSQGDMEAWIARADPQSIRTAAGHDAPVWGDNVLSIGQFKALEPVAVADGLYAFRSHSGIVESKAHHGAPFILDVRALGRLTAGRPSPPPDPGLVNRILAGTHAAPGSTHARSPYEILPPGGR